MKYDIFFRPLREKFEASWKYSQALTKVLYVRDIIRNYYFSWQQLSTYEFFMLH